MSHLIRFDIDSKKGIAFLETLLDKVGGEYNYMALLKLAFFADRYHIRNYARPVVGDIYYAMKLGPVPSNLKDIIEIQDIYEGNIRKISKYNVKLFSSRAIDNTLFSKSDREAIDFSIDNFAELGKKNEWFLPNLTHAYPEWDKYKDQFTGNGVNNRFEMDYIDFLKNAPPNHEVFRSLKFRDPFIPLTEPDRQMIIDEIVEITSLYSE